MTTAAQPSPLVCVCAYVTECRIVEAIQAGSRDLAAVRNATGACSGCGDCHSDIEELVEMTLAFSRSAGTR